MKKISLLVLLFVFVLSSCKKKSQEPLVTVPVVSTSSISNISVIKASGGGNITSDGGSAITATGICWSKTNTTPSLSDNKAAATGTSGAFTIELTALESNTTYYVRAYATNAVGTAYGQVVSFSTAPNLVPVVSAPVISGTQKTYGILTLAYLYSDPENDLEGASVFQWYVAASAAGAGETAIPGATEKTYVLQDSDLGKYIRVGITPKALSGSATGMEVRSAFTAAIAVGTDVTFTYNGKSVTYGIIISETTGRKWLDRNLGAVNVPRDETDFVNFGDLFQWGRGADGHQVTSWLLEYEGRGQTVNGTTSSVAPFAYSNTDQPGHSKFILAQSEGFDGAQIDWRKPQNNNLWQLTGKINNPCPAGWHVPTLEEFKAEDFTGIYNGFQKLKFTTHGYRNLSGYYFYGSVFRASYWTSTVAEDINKRPTLAFAFEFSQFNSQAVEIPRSMGYPVRCIKN